MERVRIYTARVVADDPSAVSWTCRCAGGATVIPTRGAWRSDDGRVYDEPACVVEVFCDGPDVRDRVVEYWSMVAGEYGEEAIAVTVEPVAVEFVSTS